MTRHLLLISCAAFFLGTISAEAADKPASTPLSGIYACTEIADNMARLACYDAAAGKLRKAESSGEFVAVESKDILNIKRDAFGFRLPSLPKLKLPSLGGKRADAFANADTDAGQIIEQTDAGEVNKVIYTVDHITEKNYDTHWFYLTNGQIWRQTDGKKFTYSKKIKPTTIVIRRASLGSFLMRINGKGRAIRVVRQR